MGGHRDWSVTDLAACVTIDDRNRLHGCWPWGWCVRVCWNRVRPVYYVGKDAIWADRAMWYALGNKLWGNQYLRTTCGDSLCIAPGHLYMTNQVLERALLRSGCAPQHRKTG